MNYQIANEHISLTVSDLGAEMQSIIKDDREYLWNGDEKYWPERAPLLFPYVGRFTEGKYLLNGAEYEMGIHGFARKLSYTLVEQTENTLGFELVDHDETRKIYPYHFRLRVQYELKENTIRITYRVMNLSDDRMYFGIGGHPGFALPFDEGLDFTDYYLEFDGISFPTRVGHTKTCFLSGVNTLFPLKDNKYLPLSHNMFDEDAIVLQNMSDKVTLRSEKGKRKVTVFYPDLPYLGFWHAPGTQAPYICIEPWSSLPSRQDIVEEFRYKYDLIRLGAGEEYRNSWEITVE